METIRFETNIPHVLSLAFAEGKPCTSPMSGEQLMFTTKDGRRFYTPPIVGQKLAEAGIGAGTTFELCKKQVGRSIEWQVRNHNATGAVSKASPAALQVQTAQTTSTQEYQKSPSYIDQQREQMARRIAASNAPAPSLSPMAARILASYVVAFEVAAALESVVDERGLALNFTREEHIRTIAATAFIEANRNPGGRV